MKTRLLQTVCITFAARRIRVSITVPPSLPVSTYITCACTRACMHACCVGVGAFAGSRRPSGQGADGCGGGGRIKPPRSGAEGEGGVRAGPRVPGNNKALLLLYVHSHAKEGFRVPLVVVLFEDRVARPTPIPISIPASLLYARRRLDRICGACLRSGCRLQQQQQNIYTYFLVYICRARVLFLCSSCAHEHTTHIAFLSSITSLTSVYVCACVCVRRHSELFLQVYLYGTINTVNGTPAVYVYYVLLPVWYECSSSWRCDRRGGERPVTKVRLRVCHLPGR